MGSQARETSGSAPQVLGTIRKSALFRARLYSRTRTTVRHEFSDTMDG
jgi:hypothetical protein